MAVLGGGGGGGAESSTGAAAATAEGQAWGGGAGSGKQQCSSSWSSCGKIWLDDVFACAAAVAAMQPRVPSCPVS